MAIGSSAMSLCETPDKEFARTAEAFIVQDCFPSDTQLIYPLARSLGLP